jgi:glucose dehydrogenase
MVSPSGKAMFSCMVCGAVATGPTTNCPQRKHADGTPVAWNLDPRLSITARVALTTCRAVERYIDSQIRKHIADNLVLDWTENKLRPLEEQNCAFCFGYGCQACLGKGTRW